MNQSVEMRCRMGLMVGAGEGGAPERRKSRHQNTPWICSGPPHLLGPWGRPVGRGKWPPRTATLRPATFLLLTNQKGALGRLILFRSADRYLILASLKRTCFFAFGSY